MARISNNKAHEIARSVAFSTFKQKEEYLLNKVRPHLVDKTREIMGERRDTIENLRSIVQSNKPHEAGV